MIFSIFWMFLCSLIIYLTVWGICQAFILTEEADAEAVTHHTDHIFVMPAHCIKWQTEAA